MNFKEILAQIKKTDQEFLKKNRKDFHLPKYNPNTHYLDLTSSNYFVALISLRDIIKLTTDYYFRETVGAKNVDLFMLTPSVSSPIGLGSDSEAIEIKFGDLTTNLVDSSQFGFEPLLLNNFNKLYCYMPSMRGENPDERHLNQFFHCETEIRGEISELKNIAQDYVKILSKTCLQVENIINLISVNPDATKRTLKNIVDDSDFINIEFDEAVKILEDHGKKAMINYTKSGRDISSQGEIELFKLLQTDVPVWLNNFDRDRVPFYQKPNPNNNEKVINSDLLMPPLIKGAFGGEVLGSGQRQDDVLEMKESLLRQGIDLSPYKWYLNLREQKHYSTTSGFGMGIERFITWMLCLSDIKDSIIYPRLKNIKTFP